MKKYIFLFIILILIGLGLYAYFILGNQMRSVRGLDSGKEYVAKMYSDYSIAGNNCQGEDSNDDGYITCNFRLTVNLQCPTFIKSYLATSCKEVGITINQN
jgi:hypothetical protein